jgi:hypothetical protein
MSGTSRTCVICSEKFELKPDKPGFANRCPACSSPKPLDPRVIRQANRKEYKEQRQRLLSELSDEEKAAVQEAEAAGRTVILLELTEAQEKALALMGLTNKRNEIATAAAASAIRDIVQREVDRAIKAKNLAESHGKKAIAAQCDVEIKKLLNLKSKVMSNAG